VLSSNLRTGLGFLAKCSFLEDLKKIYTEGMKNLLATKRNLASFGIIAA